LISLTRPETTSALGLGVQTPQAYQMDGAAMERKRATRRSQHRRLALDESCEVGLQSDRRSRVFPWRAGRCETVGGAPLCCRSASSCLGLVGPRLQSREAEPAGIAGADGALDAVAYAREPYDCFGQGGPGWVGDLSGDGAGGLALCTTAWREEEDHGGHCDAACGLRSLLALGTLSHQASRIPHTPSDRVSLS
jgi:hypothetical protein